MISYYEARALVLGGRQPVESKILERERTFGTGGGDLISPPIRQMEKQKRSLTWLFIAISVAGLIYAATLILREPRARWPIEFVKAVVFIGVGSLVLFIAGELIRRLLKR